MKKYPLIFAAVLTLFAAVALDYIVPHTSEKTLTPQMQDAMRTYLQESQQTSVGATQPIAGQTYNLAGSGISSSATTIALTSLTIKQTGQPILTADLVGSGGTFYVTVEPGSNSKQEIVGCTGVTQGATSATLTGCTRGLSPISPYTASTTLQFTHSGGSQVIFSDPPQLFQLYAALANAQTISGVWTFNSTTPPGYDSNYTASGNQFVSFAQLNATAIAGAGTSTFSALGLTQLASSLQIASSTASSTAGGPLVVGAKFATTTPGTLCNGGIWNCIPVAQVSGFISQAWLDLTKAFTFSTTTQYIANVGTLTATTSATVNNLTLTGTFSPAANTTWSQLVSTSTSIAYAANIGATTTFAAANDLHVVTYMPGVNYQNFCFYFNSDRGANYGIYFNRNYVGNPNGNNNGSGQSLLIADGLASATTTNAYLIMDIKNVSGQRKMFSYTMTESDTGSDAGPVLTGNGVWNNTSTQITGITYGTGCGGTGFTVPANSSFTVYGQ